MADDPKLRVLYNADQGLPPWGPGEIEDAHRALAEAIAQGDHVCIVSLRRDPQGHRTGHSYRMSRGPRTSIYELVGAVHAAVADWLEGR
jgi:hypothetical protein